MPAISRLAATLGLGLLGLAATAMPALAQGPAPGGAAPAPAQAPAAAPAVRIGAIDMDKAFEGYKKAEFLREQIKQEIIKKNADLSNLSNQMRDGVKVLEGLDPTGNDFKLKEAELTRLKVQFETEREQAQSQFARRDAEALSTIYKDIQDMAARVARSKGLHFVVKVTNDVPSGSDPNSVLAAMSHSIVFYDPSLDVTEMVVYNLNLQYEKQGGATVPPAASAAAAPTDRSAVPASAPPTQTGAAPARPTR